MYRTHTCGELRIEHAGNQSTLAGWVQYVRQKGGVSWIVLRDRYGFTQLVFEEGKTKPDLLDMVRTIGRETVLQASGEVIERYSKNKELPTGDIELLVDTMTVLNHAATPPFTIEEETDGGEELRMKYRYLDLRRPALQRNMALRYRVNRSVRNYLDSQGFMDLETPFLIKSTPEGARDFVVPSRMNEGQFYALPQSPQTFKQLLMVSGYDRYYQIVKCFRDEDLRADRQPEFTQVDCEMAFVEQEDILQTFEGLFRHVFTEIKGAVAGEDTGHGSDKPGHGGDVGTRLAAARSGDDAAVHSGDTDAARSWLSEPIPRMTWDDAMRDYGNDKPDLRFGMKLQNLKANGQNECLTLDEIPFPVIESAEAVIGVVITDGAAWTRKQTDELTEWVKRPQIGMSGIITVRYNPDGSFKSSADKFFTQHQLSEIAAYCSAQEGDLILILAGAEERTRKAASELRLHLGNQLGLRNPAEYKPLWVIDFPLFEYAEEDQRWVARHHPFTSPKPEHIALLADPAQFGKIKANAYDIVLNGTEIGGGSIRIFQRELQEQMFAALGMSKQEAHEKFGFLLGAFEYGAPPHGGIAFGFDRLCALLGGQESIRDFIAFPKNNSGRDMMLDAPSAVDDSQLKELGLKLGL